MIVVRLILFIFIMLQRFIRSEEDDIHPSWEQRLVKRYYDKLFKEYPLQRVVIFEASRVRHNDIQDLLERLYTY